MANWQGWAPQDLGASDDGGGGMGAPGVFRPDGSFQWYDGRTEPTVLIIESDPSGVAHVDGQGTRVPISVARANNLTITGQPAADPSYDDGSFFQDLFKNGVLPAAAIIGGGSALTNLLGPASGTAGVGSVGGDLATNVGTFTEGGANWLNAAPGTTMPAAGQIPQFGGYMMPAAEFSMPPAGPIPEFGGYPMPPAGEMLPVDGADWGTPPSGPMMPPAPPIPSGAATAAGTAAGTAAAQTAFQKLLAGDTSAANLAALAGQALPGVLGAFASNEQAGALSDLAAKYDGYGAPSRQRYEASYAPGFDLSASDPGYKGALDSASQAIMSRLSASGGNPYGNPGALVEANKAIVNGTALPALQNYRNQNANTGALGQLAGSVTGLQTAGIGANSNMYGSLAGAAADVVTPRQQQTSLADLMKQMKAIGSPLA